MKAMTYLFQEFESVNVFMDDILISSNTLEEHQKDLALVFEKVKF
jgi:hypothetical protein